MASEICVVYGGEEGSVPGMPDDVVEWLLAVYLLVCRYQHSVLEFSGTTVFDPPPPQHLNIPHQSIRLGSRQGCGCQMEFALDPLSSWLVFQAPTHIQIVISTFDLLAHTQVEALQGKNEAALWYKKSFPSLPLSVVEQRQSHAEGNGFML